MPVVDLDVIHMLVWQACRMPELYVHQAPSRFQEKTWTSHCVEGLMSPLAFPERALRVKSKMLLRSLEVKDARNMGCPLKEAAHNGQSLSEKAAVWAATVKTGGTWLPKPLRVHILPMCTTISDMETWIFFSCRVLVLLWSDLSF